VTVMLEVVSVESMMSADVSKGWDGSKGGRGVEPTYGRHKERAKVMVLRSSRVRVDASVLVEVRDRLGLLGCIGVEVDVEAEVEVDWDCLSVSI